jgi:hypothetical protein
MVVADLKAEVLSDLTSVANPLSGEVIEHTITGLDGKPLG